MDLLDTYMKNTKDKEIKPYGGALYEQYTYAWNPPGSYVQVLFPDVIVLK